MASVQVKPFKPKQQKRRLFRANEPLLSVLMWGVNHTINELLHVSIPPLLMNEDFKAFSKTRIENHLYNKDNLPGHFKFKEYCPLVFRDLRERFHVDDSEYTYSLTHSQPTKASVKGRSGAKFYLSHDKKYMIKMIIKEEVALMHQLLQQYHAHVVESEGGTLLPHYIGMYRVTVEGVEHYLLIMRNVLPSNLKVHKKYDLKGSLVARSASEKEKAKDLPTYKDKDFIGDGLKIKVGPVAKKKLMDTLEKDVAFLTKLNIMDYSLLLGIHSCLQAQEEESAEEGDEEDGEEEEELEDGEPCSGDDGIGAEAGSGATTGSGTALSPPEDEAEQKAAAAATSGLPRPFVAESGKEATRAIEKGLWPVIDKSSDVFAVLSNDEAEPKIYFMGLIDVLTLYGARKRAAHAAKTVKHGARAEISTVRPEQYARRFLEFVNRIVE